MNTVVEKWKKRISRCQCKMCACPWSLLSFVSGTLHLKSASWTFLASRSFRGMDSSRWEKPQHNFLLPSSSSPFKWINDDSMPFYASFFWVWIKFSPTSWPALGSNLLVWIWTTAWMKWVLCLVVAWMVAVLRWTRVPIQWGPCVCVLRRELRSSKIPSVSLSEETLCSGFGRHCSLLGRKPSKTHRIILFFFSQNKNNLVTVGALLEHCVEQVTSQIVEIHRWSLWIMNRKLFLL